MIKVVVLGAGNVGTHLCNVFEKSDKVLLLQNYNRKGQPVLNSNVPVTSKLSNIASAEVYVVTYNDNALLEEASTLKELNGLVVHTSGATPMDVFNKLDHYGVFYPLQSFTKSVAVDFSEIPIAVEANSKQSETVLSQLARSISTEVYQINSKQRNALHVAAVFVNNFSNFMFTQAHNVCSDFGIDFRILKPLITETITKIETSNPKDVQTGPAIRNDSKTIERHLSTLKDEQQKELYAMLTKAIQQYYKMSQNN